MSPELAHLQWPVHKKTAHKRRWCAYVAEVGGMLFLPPLLPNGQGFNLVPLKFDIKAESNKCIKHISLIEKELS